MCPKRYLNLWYVWRNPCNYLALTLTTSQMDRMRFHMTHITLEFHRMRPKQFPKLMVRSAQTLHPSCVKISTISKQAETSFHLSLVHLGVPSVSSKMILEPMVCMAQAVHLSCTDTNTVSKRTKMIFHMTHFT